LELGVGSNDSRIQKLISDITDLRRLVLLPLPKNPSEFLAPLGDTAQQKKLYDTTLALQEGLEETITKNKKKRQEQDLKDTQAALNKEAKFYAALGSEVKGVFEGIFTTLATTGKLSLDGLGQSLEKLLIKLAATAAEAAILSLILSSITGGTSIAASLGASSAGFGSLFKALIPHAEGGVFTGPTQIGNHVFGEGSTPEFLVGQTKLEALFAKQSSNSSGDRFVTRISGNDIVIVKNRQDRYNNRNFGNFTK